MRGARPRDPPPIRLRAAIGAAIDDDPLALMAQLERQGTGMRVVVEAARRRFAGVDQNEALEGLQPVEAGVGGMRRRAPLGLGPRQNEVDKNSVFLERIVEQ